MGVLVSLCTGMVQIYFSFKNKFVTNSSVFIFYLFVFLQAIYRNARELGLQTLYKSREAVIKLIVKYLIALALLPANKPVEGFYVSSY